jgi:hypothetical protein
MGGTFCNQSTIDLPEYGETFSTTDLPAWVSAGGRALFDQAVGLASSPQQASTIDKLASYGPEGNLLTEDEQLAAQIIRDGAGSFQPFLDKASGVADTLGQGFDSATRSELMGDPYSGMSNEQLQGSYTGATRDELLGDSFGGFSLDSAQPYLDIYQGAQDASIRELERQTARNQMQTRANAARSGSFGGSRLGISEAMLGSEGAMGAADLRARAAAEGLGFAANRFDTDRTARFNAEDVMRGQYESDRASRFDTEGMRRGQYDADRSSRFAAEDTLRSGFESDEASRIQQMSAYQNLAPLTQSLQQAAAQGLISSGEARRRLDQAVLDLAREEELSQENKSFERLNFALGALQGVPYQQKTFGYNMGTSTAQSPSIFGQTIGAAGTIGAGYLASKK